jgi:hypothetical protein
MSWNDSWDEHRPCPCAMCAFRASTRGICAGRTPGAAGRPTFNPWVLGSSPRRPTSRDIPRCKAFVEPGESGQQAGQTADEAKIAVAVHDALRVIGCRGGRLSDVAGGVTYESGL